MYGKFILAAVLIAFLYVQLGASLQCHSCGTPLECRNPSNVNCTQGHANTTSVHLNKHFINVQTIISNNFNCLIQNYTQNNQLNMTYMGCVYRESRPCDLQLNASYVLLVKQKCNECSGDLCNKADSAVSFSINMFTIMSTVLATLMVKSFAY